MAIHRAEKEQLVTALSQQFNESKSTVFVNYTGMGVKAMQDLRKQMRENGASVVIAKNTLIKLAGEKAQVPSEALTDTVLTQQTAVVFGNDDAITPIQVLGAFIKANEFPQVKGGIVEGQFQSKDGVIAISKLPSREVLYAQVVGAVSAPMYGVVGTLQANIQKLLFILSAKASQG
jgi:large subunit ribosomal protein L10